MPVNPSLRLQGIIAIQRILTICKGNKNVFLVVIVLYNKAYNPLSPQSPACFYFVKVACVWSRDGTKVQEKLWGQPPLTTPGRRWKGKFFSMNNHHIRSAVATQSQSAQNLWEPFFILRRGILKNTQLKKIVRYITWEGNPLRPLEGLERSTPKRRYFDSTRLV